LSFLGSPSNFAGALALCSRLLYSPIFLFVYKDEHGSGTVGKSYTTSSGKSLKSALRPFDIVSVGAALFNAYLYRGLALMTYECKDSSRSTSHVRFRSPFACRTPLMIPSANQTFDNVWRERASVSRTQPSSISSGRSSYSSRGFSSRKKTVQSRQKLT
jgi:hypothetical protein